MGGTKTRSSSQRGLPAQAKVAALPEGKKVRLSCCAWAVAEHPCCMLLCAGTGCAPCPSHMGALRRPRHLQFFMGPSLTTTPGALRHSEGFSSHTHPIVRRGS